jgi:PAS domain S-box-containing protein
MANTVFVAVDPNGFASQAALMVFDDDLNVLCWNDGAEALTGIPADEAVGRPCWAVIAGRDDEGATVCHSGCSRARYVRKGNCLPAETLHARTATGRRRIALETIAAEGDDGALFIHVMRDAPAVADPEKPAGPAPQLTPRQQQILALLGEGRPPKVIAQELGLMETTVRNHIRLLHLALGAHSQLEAVARARAYGLL